MTEAEAAVIEVVSTLDALSIPYMIIGGIAVTLLGVRRATFDVDATIVLEPERTEETVQAICARLRSQSADPLGLVRDRHVLPLVTSRDFRVDLVIATIPYERAAIERAKSIRIDDHVVRIVTPEDLILMKLLSERAKDRDDAVALLRRYRRTLDRAYLEPRLGELSEALAMPDILQTYRREIGRS